MKKTSKKKMDVAVGEFLKSKRLEAGLSQVHVTEKLGYTSPQHLSNIERGVSPVGMTTMKQLMRIYDMDATDMIDFMLDEHKSYLQREFALKKKSNSRN